MHLLYVFQLEDVLHVNVCWNLIQFSRLSILLDFFPVGLIIPLDRLDTVLPWPVQTSILLHAVYICPIVDSHLFEMGFTAMLLKTRNCYSRLLKIEKGLNVNSSLFPFL